jgi:hypothetical protein
MEVAKNGPIRTTRPVDFSFSSSREVGDEVREVGTLLEGACNEVQEA